MGADGTAHRARPAARSTRLGGVLSRFDDYPVHQVAVPIAQAGNGHPDFYDRFWFNGYTEDLFFALAMGSYPNRGVIDAAFSVVHDGHQRSVFTSGRAPHDRSVTAIGPDHRRHRRADAHDAADDRRPRAGSRGRADVRGPHGGLRGAPPDPLHRRPPAVRRHPGHPVRRLVGHHPHRRRRAVVRRADGLGLQGPLVGRAAGRRAGADGPAAADPAALLPVGADQLPRRGRSTTSCSRTPTASRGPRAAPSCR